ncbi:aldo/keto reductase [Streptomyces sp. NBC_01262]|uniref:aldo/keto reductase n=1 Tax=Streptomyces sp. NBC_01262 TaxID=2903803 RepID=UPI002E35DD5A|nr:aldo/keto reductase [Streptomyces sp. NBC_01262]
MTAALGLGTHRLRNVPAAACRAATAGTAWVDTAPNYLRGHAHRLLAPELVGHPQLKVATKIGFLAPGADTADAAGVLTAAEAAHGHSLAAPYVRWQTDHNRATLGRTRLDLVFIHNPERHPDPDTLPDTLLAAFTVLEEAVAAGHLTAYGVATWSAFADELLTVSILDRLATEAAGTAGHHLRAVQLPVSLIQEAALAQALDGCGPITHAADLGWEVFASAPLHGGELLTAATPELTRLLHPDISTTQACLLAAASCPGVSNVLLSASTPAHWDAALAALAEPAIAPEALRKVLDVLAPHRRR